MPANRVILQRDHSDCGPACLASVLAHYGRDAPVSRLRQRCRTDGRGTSMHGMIRVLEELGFEARGLEGSAGNLTSLPMPFIVHMEKDSGLHHYVVVYGIGKKHYRVMDPALGKLVKLSREAFEKDWSGALIALVPGACMNEVITGPTVQHRFRLLIRPLWKGLLLATCSAVLYTVMGLSGSLYLGKITDHVLVTGNRGLLNLMSMGMLIITLMMVILGTGRNMIMLRSGQVIDNQLILSYYRQLFSLPQRFFDSMKTGEIISRMGDAVKIRNFVNDALIGVLVNALTLVCSILVLCIIEMKLALLLAVFLAAYTLLYLAYNYRNKRQERKIMESAANLEEHLVDSLKASTHIRQELLKEINRGMTETRFNHLLDQTYKSGLNSIMVSSGTESLNRIFTILLLWTGSILVISENLSPGNLMTCYALLGYCTGPLAALVNVNKVYQNARIAADRLFEMFDLDTEIREKELDFQKDDFGDIHLEEISFSYGSRGTQLSNITLTIPEGSFTLIKGRSGSGKSTLARLMAHQYPPDCGHVYLNQCDTSYYSKDSLRSIVGFLPQDPAFLRGTLLENLAPGEDQPDMRKLAGLLRSAGLLSLVQSLPMGFNTHVESMGMNFSGGERKRLAMVRLLYRDPPMFILDEPGAALDQSALRLLNRLLLEMKEEGKTVVLITHRKHFDALADQHIVLEQGRIACAESPVPRMIHTSPPGTKVG